MINNPIIASWDWPNATTEEIADQLNQALEEAGIDSHHFIALDDSGDRQELRLMKGPAL